MLAGGVALKMQKVGASQREERACLETLTRQAHTALKLQRVRAPYRGEGACLEALARQGNAAGLLQQCKALLELQVAEAGKALPGRGLPAAQMDRAVLKAICALVSIS